MSPTSRSRATPCSRGPTEHRQDPLSYRVWNGSAWTAAATITTPQPGAARQLRLAASRVRRDGAVVSNASSQDYALVWNGSSWGNAVTLAASGAGGDPPTSPRPTCSRAAGPGRPTGMSPRSQRSRSGTGPPGWRVRLPTRWRDGERALADATSHPGYRQRRLRGAHLQMVRSGSGRGMARLRGAQVGRPGVCDHSGRADLSGDGGRLRGLRAGSLATYAEGAIPRPIPHLDLGAEEWTAEQNGPDLGRSPTR